MKHASYLFIVMLVLSTACANRGIGPQGGPKDSIPPQIVKTTPVNGVLNYKGQTITLLFDEYVQLDNPSENILVSPPQPQRPEIEATGKKVKLTLKEDLKDSTTYTIDFGNSIQDNNEKNPLKDYVFSFSTGGCIDSLEIYGNLIQADNLNPLPGIVVGFHSCLDDSAISTTAFERIGRTNAAGEFAIRNIHEGTYRLYALDDVSRDFRYQAGEGIAFMDSLITPSIHISTEIDTIYRDSVAGDSVIHVPDSIIKAEYYYFEPADLLLRFFKEDKQHQYFERATRTKAHYFTLTFAAPNKQLPSLRALRTESDSLMRDTSWVDFTQHCICQANRTKDTLTYWLTDSVAIKMDTIRMEMRYWKTDSTYTLFESTDTIQVVYRHPNKGKAVKKNKTSKKTDKKKENITDTIATAYVAPRPILKATCTAKNPCHIEDTVTLLSPTPLKEIRKDSIRLFMKQDTLWKAIPCQIAPTDSTYMCLQVLYNTQVGTDYKLTVDSAGMTDIYDATTRHMEWTWETRAKEDYATLMIRVQPYIANAYIQLLNTKDEPVLTHKVEEQGTQLVNLMPGEYYMRMYIDANGDGKWTTGDWNTKRQPEEVYYFSKKLTLRANWDFEESFLWKSLPLLGQKPKALLPKDKTGQQKK